MIRLIDTKSGKERDFKNGHAQAILNLPRTSWALPEDSEFQFIDGRISKRRSKKASQE